MKRAVLAVVTSLMLAVGGLNVDSPASAATAVSGEVGCINSMVSGVWIAAEKSKSGWAKWEVPIKMGGHSKAAYRYSLSKGGRYKVHVGCGGTSKNWAVTAKSGWVGGTKNNFVCNDLKPGGGVRLSTAKKILAQGVDYKTCKKK